MHAPAASRRAWSSRPIAVTGAAWNGFVGPTIPYAALWREDLFPGRRPQPAWELRAAGRRPAPGFVLSRRRVSGYAVRDRTEAVTTGGLHSTVRAPSRAHEEASPSPVYG